MPEEGAGCRFRIAQFIPYLRSVGIDVTLAVVIHGRLFSPRLPARSLSREDLAIRDVVAEAPRLAARHRELRCVLLYRELFPIGPAVVERLLAMRRRPPLVFDFDDAIFLPNVSEANQVIQALKWPGKVATIIRHSDHVVAGNAYLAEYARRFNPAVTVIPTCVDTTKFVPTAHPSDHNGGPPDRRPIVGWIGSPTTAPYVRALIPVLQRVAEKHPFVLRVSGAGESFDVGGVSVEQPGWTINSEVSLFNTCDIGVYPLADDEWSKGKCGFKAIEFMACGVPVVASAVGVNREIIEDGVNGFLAANPEQWVDKLLRLLSDPTLRGRFGKAGRDDRRKRLFAANPRPEAGQGVSTCYRRSVNGIEPSVVAFRFMPHGGSMRQCVSACEMVPTGLPRGRRNPAVLSGSVRPGRDAGLRTRIRQHRFAERSATRRLSVSANRVVALRRPAGVDHAQTAHVASGGHALPDDRSRARLARHRRQLSRAGRADRRMFCGRDYSGVCRSATGLRPDNRARRRPALDVLVPASRESAAPSRLLEGAVLHGPAGRNGPRDGGTIGTIADGCRSGVRRGARTWIRDAHRRRPEFCAVFHRPVCGGDVRQNAVASVAAGMRGVVARHVHRRLASDSAVVREPEQPLAHRAARLHCAIRRESEHRLSAASLQLSLRLQ